MMHLFYLQSKVLTIHLGPAFVRSEKNSLRNLPNYKKWKCTIDITFALILLLRAEKNTVIAILSPKKRFWVSKCRNGKKIKFARW